jgi:hypothetical protein
MTGWMADDIVGKSPRLLQGVKTDHSVFEDCVMRCGVASVGRARRSTTVRMAQSL